MNFNESYYKQKAEAEILKCRPGDWEHAQRVVAWIKKLTPEEFNEKELLIAAGYIHDIGWKDIFPKDKISITKDELLKNELQANQNTIPYVTNFLKKLDFSSNEIQTILSLIAAADEHKSSNELEAIIVDADNLSKLTMDHIKQKFAPESWLQWYELWTKEFPNRIKTERGKQIYPKLLSELKKEIELELI